jgi:hypothetical protein
VVLLLVVLLLAVVVVGVLLAFPCSGQKNRSAWHWSFGIEYSPARYWQRNFPTEVLELVVYLHAEQGGGIKPYPLVVGRIHLSE